MPAFSANSFGLFNFCSAQKKCFFDKSNSCAHCAIFAKYKDIYSIKGKRWISLKHVVKSWWICFIFLWGKLSWNSALLTTVAPLSNNHENRFVGSHKVAISLPISWHVISLGGGKIVLESDALKRHFTSVLVWWSWLGLHSLQEDSIGKLR